MIEKKQKIVLMGYMASGKTSVGKALSTKLKLPFIDLDQYISQCEKMSVSELFEQKGEAYFRNRELFYLEQLMSDANAFVLALGGGTPMIGGAMSLIKRAQLSIYLYNTVETLYQRLKPKEVERPLLTDMSKDLLKDYIISHLKERDPYYFQANLTVSVNDKTIDDVANVIKGFLENDR